MSIYQCMLLMFSMLCVSRTRCTINEPTDEDYRSDASREYEDYDASTEISTPIPASTVELTSVKTDTPIMSSSIQPPTKVIAEIVTCPKNCKCSDIFQHVNCSFQMLKSIPDNLPLNLQQLDLSHNEIESLNVTQLNKYTEIRELIIRNNSITKIINSEDFIKLEKLRTIDLTANKLQPLNGTEFTKATHLGHLTLSNNSGIIADSNILFAVMVKNLHNLDIANCNIQQLSDNIFENVPSLIMLDMRDNPLESNLNSEAFKYLIKLRTLRISSVAEENILNLCKALESIDLINMDKYDLSCFELSAGSTFDESTIKSGQSTFITDTDNLYKTNTIAPPVIEPMKTVPAKNTSRTTTPMIDETKIQSSKQQISSISQNEKPILSPSSEMNKTKATQNIESSQINISTETIYLLLTGLIALTLVSLMIGIICRLDCCGIKTKCCRTNHNNRATSQDHGQSHEEIPLNKV